MTELHNVGFTVSGKVLHPAQGTRVVSLEEEYPPVTVRYVGVGEGFESGKGKHHHEGVDDDANELVNVDVPTFVGDRSFEPGRKMSEDGVGETPLKLKAVAESSHGNITSIRSSKEVGIFGNEETEGASPDGWVGVGKQRLQVIQVSGCSVADADFGAGAPCMA